MFFNYKNLKLVAEDEYDYFIDDDNYVKCERVHVSYGEAGTETYYNMYLNGENYSTFVEHKKKMYFFLNNKYKEFSDKRKQDFFDALAD